MPRLLVNCHGGYVAAGPGLLQHPAAFITPAGVSVHFYVAHDGLLANHVGYQVLANRMHGLAPGVATQTILPNSPCPNYYGVPYGGLGAANGLFLERAGPRGGVIWEPILQAGAGQNWGLPAAGTVHAGMVVLPAVRGGAPYARSVILLSDLVNCPGVTDVQSI
jgi:hypothetical protein